MFENSWAAKNLKSVYTGEKLKKDKTAGSHLEPIRMEYESYVMLRDLLDNAIAKFENDFRVVCSFIPAQTSDEIRKGIPSGIERAHEIFSEHYSKMRKAKTQLLVAVGSTYKDHPNVEIRKFWGLDE